jgi:hypothetical protein
VGETEKPSKRPNIDRACMFTVMRDPADNACANMPEIDQAMTVLIHLLLNFTSSTILLWTFMLWIRAKNP